MGSWVGEYQADGEAPGSIVHYLRFDSKIYEINYNIKLSYIKNENYTNYKYEDGYEGSIEVTKDQYNFMLYAGKTVFDDNFAFIKAGVWFW